MQGPGFSYTLSKIILSWIDFTTVSVVLLPGIENIGHMVDRGHSV